MAHFQCNQVAFFITVFFWTFCVHMDILGPYLLFGLFSATDGHAGNSAFSLRTGNALKLRDTLLSDVCLKNIVIREAPFCKIDILPVSEIAFNFSLHLLYFRTFSYRLVKDHLYCILKNGSSYDSRFAAVTVRFCRCIVCICCVCVV